MSQKLTICLFSTGVVSTTPLDSVSRATLSLFGDLLTAGGRLPEPWQHFALTIDHHPGFSSFVLRASQEAFFTPSRLTEPLVISTGYVCADGQRGDSAWRALEAAYHQHVKDCLAQLAWDAPAVPDKPAGPWLGVIICPTARYLSCVGNDFLDELHLCLGAALCEFQTANPLF